MPYNFLRRLRQLWLPQARKPRPARQPRAKVNLSLESLETRFMPAATITLASGLSFVEGDNTLMLLATISDSTGVVQYQPEISWGAGVPGSPSPGILRLQTNTQGTIWGNPPYTEPHTSPP